MSRSLRRGAVAAVIIATAPILAACSAGDNAASLQVKPDNAATSIGSTLKLNGIVVVTTAIGQAPANVTVNISNTGDQADNLVSVAVGSTQAVLSGPATINSGGSLLLSGPGQVSATVPTLTAMPGQNANVTFTFANAGSVTVQALVSAGTGIYASYAPVAPTPSPSASPSLAATASASATSKATKPAKSTASATPSATKTP
ncbi:hypothetical protein ABIA33_000851 [Streptacidiphilus sp. MAP12-16]|uniref:DUF461 domain-containing protein n=1 Tax=Streptacidiphilus sp. MAP12-16 TaxID=3156300 RepID=UPI00351112F6